MRTFYLFLLFSISFLTFGQEICDNGIDDDGDGLIDLNDNDCLCGNTNVTSIIPNPSFEIYSSCPNYISQLNFATPWIQATQATTDYFNNCGFTPQELILLPHLLNYPDGNGIVGALITRDWKEYLGAKLTTTMNTGTNYQLTLNVAAYLLNELDELSSEPISSIDPLNITIFGCNNGNNLPVSTTLSPNSIDPTWIEIGHVLYTPNSNWQNLTITFTPQFDVNAIMIGSPDILPNSYPINRSNINPYFLFDNLILNEESAFGANITSTGSYCSNNLILNANISLPTTGNLTYQWYLNGIAILNATSSTFDISNNINLTGEYNVVITDDNNCFAGILINITDFLENPDVTITNPNCPNGTGAILINTIADEYSINNGLTWSTNPFFDLLSPGNYDIKIKKNNCYSIVKIANIANPIINSTTLPLLTSPQQFCIQENTTINNIQITGQNILWYDALTDGNLLPATSILQNGITYYASQTINGCESNRVPVTITIQNTAAPTGNGNQSFCSTANATLNEIIITGTNIIWYDSATNGNVLPSATLLANNTTYYVTQTVNNCESPTRLTITINLINTLNATNYSESICDDLDNGTEIINLTNYNSNLITSNGNTFSYYISPNGAENQLASDLINNASNYNLTVGNTIIYVRIDSPNTCHQVIELNLTLFSKPFLSINDIMPICEGASITISAGNGFDDYLWSTNEVTSTITVFQPGNYSVSVSEYHGSLTCSTTKNFSVVNSNIGTISQIISSDWTENENTISVTLSSNSTGDYEYSLNGIDFQDSNIFFGLENGEYTVYVQDKNGCGVSSDEIYLLMYPKFFTPNGDGFNDFWKIKLSENEPNLTVKIFDRYGKFIKQLGPNSIGWDGTYLGQQAPSSDYWFVVTRENGKEHKEHFTLKR